MQRANFIGAPAFFNLNQACRAITEAFGYHLYLVGSAITTRDYRDVDVRCILPDEDYARLFSRGPKDASYAVGSPTYDARWSLFCTSISEWLSARTGLPVDFQFQQQSDANEKYPAREHARHALGIFLVHRPSERGAPQGRPRGDGAAVRGLRLRAGHARPR